MAKWERGREPERARPWAEVPKEKRLGLPYVGGQLGAEESAISRWGFERFTLFRAELQRVRLAWQSVAPEEFSDLWVFLKDVFSLLSDAAGSGASAEEQLEALVVVRNGTAQAHGLAQRVIDRVTQPDSEAFLQTVASALVRFEQAPGFQRGHLLKRWRIPGGRTGPFTPDEAATISIACWLEKAPRKEASFAAKRRAWKRRLERARK